MFSQHLSDLIGPIDQSVAIVIQSRTLILADRMDDWKLANDVQAASPSVQTSTASNLLSVGSTRRPVDLRHSVLLKDLKIYQATEAELRELFDAPHSLTRAWEQFRMKFQKATHLLSFSNVGFNHPRDQAAFVLSTACGGLCGSGQLVLMKRGKTGWKTQESTNLWRS